jgi:hypothetical protein
MAEEAETLKATPEPQEAASEEASQARPGITLPAVLTGTALLLVLALALPYWSLVKNYPLGFGGYLPLEALVLVLALLLFNRFRGGFALVVGLVAAALIVPTWHEAVYARTDRMVKMLGPFAHWLRLTFAGTIEPALDSPGRPALLVAAGALMVFAVGAIVGQLAASAVGFLRHRFSWREIAVVFVLLSVGTYSCKSIVWLVGLLPVPFKFDTKERNFKEKFLRPRPVDQQVVTDEELLTALGELEKNPDAVLELEEFRGYRTADTLRALRVLKENPKDAAALSMLRDRAYGPEARQALDLLGKEGKADEDLRKELGRICAQARSQVHRNAHEEALDAVRSYNAEGLPSFILPYDMHRFDNRTPEGRLRYDAEVEDLKAYSKGWLKRAPPPPKITVPRVRDFTTTNAETGEDVFDAEAYRNHCEQYAIEYRRYQGLLSEDRGREWGKFWGRWKGPLAWWLPLLVMIMMLQVFLAALLRRQWCDHEKLMFPHAEAVRGLIEGEELGSRTRRILNSRLLWIGAGISVVIFLFQGLNAYFPEVPAPNLHQISLKTFLSEPPWNNMGKNLNLQPYLLGIAYLLTTEVSLSIWVFAVINQLMRVMTMAWGLPRQQRWSVHGEVINSDALYAGAMIVFVIWLLWGARRHIWYCLRRALGLIPADDLEKQEPMGYPLAFWGFWLSLAGIFVWFALVGLKLWIMAVIVGLYLVLVVLLCRLVSEAGLIAAALNWWPFWPNSVFCHFFGFGHAGTFGKTVAFKNSWLSPGGAAKVKKIPCNVRNYGVFQFIWPSMLFHLQLTPFVLAGFKLTETEPRRKRLLTWLMVAALLGAGLVFLHGVMSTTFEQGADGVKPYPYRAFSWAFSNTLLRDIVTGERMWSPDLFRLSMMSLGGLAMTGLLILRSTFYWWPLHPIGLAAFGTEWGMWFSFLLGWLIKRTALAYGGGEFSQKVNPFFYGLIIGQFVMAAFWGIAGACGSGVPADMAVLPAAGY